MSPVPDTGAGAGVGDVSGAGVAGDPGAGVGDGVAAEGGRAKQRGVS